MAKECQIIQALWHMLPKDDGGWLNSRKRRDELDYLISNVPVTDEERSNLRAYIDTVLQEEVKDEEGIVQVVAFTMACVYAIALSVITYAFIKKSDYSRPTKKKKDMKPKHAEKKEKYYYLLSFAHHVYVMLLEKSSKLCGMIWKTPSLLSVASLAAYDSVADAFRSTANVSLGIIKHLYTSICSILSRGMKCLVVIPRMISFGIGMFIRLPSKLIRGAIGPEHDSIDQPPNSSPQLRPEAPQLVMSPSSAVSVIAVDEQKVKSMLEQNTIRKLEAVYDDSSDRNLNEEPTPTTSIQQEDVPSEIGIVNSTQVLAHETITEASTSSLNDKSNISTLELNENDPLLIFLRSQHQCIKGSVDEFYVWLVKYENIDFMMALKEAVSDDDYLNDTMRIGDRSYGVKGFKLKSFRCAILEYEDTKPAQESKASAETTEPPEELVCPISLVLMTKDPVVAADGITYERASIEDWFKKSEAKISDAQERMKENPRSKADQRVVNNGICSPVYGSKMNHLVLVPNTGTRNMARAYEEKKEEVQ